MSVEAVDPEGPLGRNLIETAETSEAYQRIFDYLTERYPLVSSGTSITRADGRYIVKFSLALSELVHLRGNQRWGRIVHRGVSHVS